MAFATSLSLAGLILAIVSGSNPENRRVFADSHKIISLYFDGQKKVITTSAATVGEALQRANVILAADDLVEPAASTQIPNGFYNINVYRARPVMVVDGATIIPGRSAFLSARLIADGLGVETYPEDVFKVEAVTDFAADGLVGHKITVVRAKPVTVLVDGKYHEWRTQAATVGQLLTEKGLPLGEKDAVAPALAASVLPGQRITITRVNEVTVTKEEVLPRGESTVTDNELEAGHKRVVIAGSDGRRTVTYHLRYHNGVEVSRQAVKIEGLVNPVTRVIAIGTKITDDVWYRLRMCESGNNYQRNSGNGYYGAYQFDLSTWQSNGGTGYPHQAPAQVQDTIAKALHARRGFHPWPTCGRTLGLI